MTITTFETTMALRDGYWVADEAGDFRKRDRIGRKITKIEDDARATPARSDGDAATKLQFAAFELGLCSSDDGHSIAARIEVIAYVIRAADSPPRRFDLHDHLVELRHHASRLPRIADKPGMLERILALLEAAIAWLERPRIEHYPAARARIYYMLPGFTMVGDDGEPVPAELSYLPVATIA
jgi:hypothetical protein